MLEILYGSGREYPHRQALEMARAEAYSGTRQIIMVPEHASHEAERALASGGAEIALYAEVLTFRQLASRVFGETGGLARGSLDEGGRLLLLRKTAEEVGPLLTMYRAASLRSDWLSALGETLSELAESGVSPETLADLAEKTEGKTREKFRDISCLYAAYEEKIRAGAADPADLNARTAGGLAESRQFCGCGFWFCGFSGFTGPELSIISALLRLRCPVRVALCWDGEEKRESEPFYKEKMTVSRLRRAAAQADTGVKIRRLLSEETSGREALLFLGREYFSPALKLYEEPAPEITLHSASDVYAECAWAAAEILELMGKGVRCREIAVAASLPEGYAAAVEAAFSYYGVPVFVSVPSDLLSRSVFSFVLSAVEAAERLEPEPLIRAMKTGFFGVNAEEADAIALYIALWGIRGERLKEEFLFHPDGFGAARTEQSDEMLAVLNENRRRVMRPLSALQGRMAEAKTGREYIEALYAFMQEVKLPDGISDRARRMADSGRQRMAEEYAQMWNILADVMTQWAATVGDCVMETEEFGSLLTTLLSAYDVDTIPVSLDQVTFGGLDRLGFSEKRYLFILGGDDGQLPPPCFRGGVLTEPEREELFSLGVSGVTTLEEMAFSEMGVLYKAFCYPKEGLFVSCPAQRNGAETRPSACFVRLNTMFPGARRSGETGADARFRLAASAPFMEAACLGAGGDRAPWAQAAYFAAQSDPELAEEVQKAVRAAGQGRMPIGCAELTEALYGDPARLSPSRIERYAGCPFSYFMRYGLRARTVKDAPFEAPEAGTFVHYVLENLFVSLKQQGVWRKNGEEKPVLPDEEELAARVKEITARYVEEVLGGLNNKNARFRRMFERLSRSVTSVAVNVMEELSLSRFVPLDMELSFSKNGDLPPYTIRTKDGRVTVSGKTDRVDGYVKDGKLYLRVVDYKTGLKAFKLSDVACGLNLQMLLYLFTLEKTGISRYREKTGEELESVVPAGILYVPARESVMTLSAPPAGEAEYRAAVARTMRRSGLLLDQKEIIRAMEGNIDGEARFLPVRFGKDGSPSALSSVCSLADFGRLSRYIERMLGQIAGEIRRGRVEASPCKTGREESACRFCDYRAACLYDETNGRDRPRWVPGFSDREFLTRLSSEEQEGKKKTGEEAADGTQMD